MATRVLEQVCDSFAEIEKWDQRVMILEIHPSLLAELMKEQSFDICTPLGPNNQIGSLFGTDVILNKNLPEGHYIAKSDDRQEPGCMQESCTSPECVVKHVHEQ